MKDLKFTPAPGTKFIADWDDSGFHELIAFHPDDKDHVALIHYDDDDENSFNGQFLRYLSEQLNKNIEMYEALKQAKEAMEYSLRGLDPHDLNTKGMIRKALETINKLGL
jgi:hypothetical protein